MIGGRREAERESFKKVPETCPMVEAAIIAVSTTLATALGVAEFTIKDQTESLREALTDQIHITMLAEEERDDLRADIQCMERQIADLKTQLAALMETA